ncbi:cupin domain-containing protein [Granulosicoccus sp. 3-233]|uniref:cupin domain-containing protein n=1 Tax=Granulosicoccus sp. 3-233 TaxID=3417969 RepID=UPI003D334C00
MPENVSETGGFDVLADVLDTMRLRGTIFFRSELAAPWGMSLEPSGLPRFHIALSGNCFVGAASGEQLSVGEMDIVMLPDGREHWIADRPGRELVQSRQAGEACELGVPMFQSGDITNRLMCGLVHFDTEMTHPILDTIPDVLHLKNIEPSDAIWLIVMAIDAEMARPKGRGGRIIDKLTEILILQLLSRYQAESGESGGFLAALGDRRLLHALALIHREPAHDWTLTSLGAQCGMSRATLLRHFEASVGLSPIAYLMNWRLVKGCNMVKYSSASLEQIAQSVGFSSARTFNRAFQRRYGRTPTCLRQDRQADLPP